MTDFRENPMITGREKRLGIEGGLASRESSGPPRKNIFPQIDRSLCDLLCDRFLTKSDDHRPRKTAWDRGGNALGSRHWLPVSLPGFHDEFFLVKSIDL